MKERVTEEMLNRQLMNINRHLDNYKLEVNGRYGYFAIDIAYKKGAGIYDTLMTGKTKSQLSEILYCIDKYYWLIK